ADGVPSNPAAWLLTSARRRVLDRLRSADVARRKMPLLVVDHLRHEQTVHTEELEEEVIGEEVGDDELRLLLLACHPARAPAWPAARGLRLVPGVPTAEIARLCLVPAATMAARLARARKRIVTAGRPFTLPDGDALAARVDVATQAIYLSFTAGCAPG